ncbi:MAG: hypothetical protein ABI624_01830 [Casimicrobiaceae bacterium]
MNCTICGKATLEGTLLCRPCKAALKRARHLTVQEYPVSARRAPTSRGARGATPAGPSSPARTLGGSETMEPSRPPERRLLLGGVAIAALAGALYLIGQEYSASSAATARARPQPLAQPRSADTAPVTASAPSAKPSLLPTVTELLEPDSPPPHRPGTTKGALARPAPALRAPAVPRPDPAYAVSLANPPLDSFAAAVEMPRTAPPPVVVAAAPPTPPPDRWQTMSEALNRCASEGGLSGFICDQRVRLASCEGYWGRVAQCPNPPENPGR